MSIETSNASNDEWQQQAILFDRVTKSFKKAKSRVNAISEISFSVKKGTITGLIGPDAAGKTTVMRLLTGLLVPDSGQITVLGNDAVKEPLKVQSCVGYMPQRFGLYEDLTTQENLDLYADLHGVDVESRSERYAELMHMTGLGDFKNRLAGRLSGGMKQKLGLACTLVRHPELLILDEPTVGVDPLSRRELWNIIFNLIRLGKTTVLLSTAYLDEAENCDRIVMLYEGRILGEGSPADFKKKVENRTYSAFTRSMSKRVFEEKILDTDGILDAIIQGDNVRIVTKEAIRPDFEFAKNIADFFIKPVQPRFEDSFIDVISKAKQQKQTYNTKALESKKEQNSGSAVIRVEKVSRLFGDFYAVKDVSFEVYPGEIFGLLGANGAGKSTTFRMLCGLLPVSSGSVHVAGVDFRYAASAARLKVGYMSQKFSLYGDLSVRQNLNFYSSAYGLRGKTRNERVQWALEEFGLTDMAGENAIGLPLGYRQRLSMACALMHNPDIIFLDEPTSGVDPIARRQFWKRINALAERNVTVMVTTHFMEEAEYCNRLAIMAAGQILTVGAPGQIRKQAADTQNPEPTIEQAFIRLIERHEAQRSDL